jgi:hypothetical protein
MALQRWRVIFWTAASVAEQCSVYINFARRAAARTALSSGEQEVLVRLHGQGNTQTPFTSP